MARIKGLRKLRSELRRFHEELSRIQTFPPSEAAEEGFLQATDSESSNQDDDAVWDSVDISPAHPRRNEADVLTEKPASHGLPGAPEKALPRDISQPGMLAERGAVSNLEVDTLQHEKLAKNSQGDSGCGEVNCQAAAWNGKSKCECHTEQVVRLSATSSFTANLGHVVSTEDGPTDQWFGSGGDPALKKGLLSAVPDLTNTISYQQTTGTRSDLAEDATSCAKSEDVNISASHQVACYGSGDIQAPPTCIVGSVGHNTGGAGSASATGYLTVSLAAVHRTTLPTSRVSVLQYSSLHSGLTAGDLDGHQVKQTQTPGGLDQNTSKSRPLFQPPWESKVQDKHSREGVFAAQIASRIKNALQGLDKHGELHQFKLFGLRDPSGRDTQKLCHTVPKPAADPSSTDAETYLQDILAALSPEKLPAEEKTQRLSIHKSASTSKGIAVEVQVREEDLVQKDVVKDGTSNTGECLCPLQRTEEIPQCTPASLTVWPNSPRAMPSGQYRTVIEISEGSPVGISYAAQDQMQPEKQEHVTVHVGCSPTIVQPAKECAAQLCPLNTCPAACDDASNWPHPPNHEVVQVKDLTEKRFFDATRLVYNLDAQKRRRRDDYGISGDCHWNCGKQSSQLQKGHKKAEPQPSKTKQQTNARWNYKDSLSMKSQAKSKAPTTRDRRITAAAGLADEIQTLMTTDMNDTLHDYLPYKYTKLDAPVTAAAEAVTRLAKEVSTIDGDQSDRRQLFAAQIGRTAFAQEAVKKLIGGGIDYDQVHKELHDINKERAKMNRTQQQSKTLLHANNNFEKYWQEPCLSPGYQGEQQDELFLNSLRQEVDSRIATRHTGPRSKKQRITHSPAPPKNAGIMPPRFPTAVSLQRTTGNYRPDGLDDILRKGHATARSSATSANLEKLVKEVEALMKKTRSVADESKVTKIGQPPQREFAVPKWLYPSAAQKQHNYKLEDYRPRSRHFVRAALRRKEVRPPDTLFKNGAPINWMLNEKPPVEQVFARLKTHPPPVRTKGNYQDKQEQAEIRREIAVDYSNSKVQTPSRSSRRKPGKKGIEFKKPGPAASAGPAKIVHRKTGREQQNRMKGGNIVGPVIDFDNPYEGDRNLWPDLKLTETRKKAAKPKTKKNQEGGAVIDFRNKFENDLKLWTTVLSGGQAPRQRVSRLELEWRRLQKDRRLVEIYGVPLPRKKADTKVEHTLGSITESLLQDSDSVRSKSSDTQSPYLPNSQLDASPSALPVRLKDLDRARRVHGRSDNLPGSSRPIAEQTKGLKERVQSKGVYVPKRTVQANLSARSRSKSPLGSHKSSSDAEDFEKDIKSELHMELEVDRSEGTRNVPKGGHFDHLGSYLAKPPDNINAMDHSPSSHSSKPFQFNDAGDQHVEPDELRARAVRNAIDGLIDDLTSEALQKEISALSASVERLDMRTEEAAKPAEDPDEEHYKSDEFYSDTELPPLNQSKHSRSIAKELEREKMELEAEVLEHALKEIVLQSVFQDQKRQMDRLQSKDEEADPEPYDLPAEEYQSKHALASTSMPAHHTQAKEEDSGASNNHVSFAGVQISSDRKYAGSQTVEYDTSSAESQTDSQLPGYERRYAGVQTMDHERRYAESQTSDSEQRDAVVQTSGYGERFAESQTNEYEQRYAGVQTIRQDTRLAESQTNEYEQRYAGVQTTRQEKRLAESQTNEYEQRYASVQTTRHDNRLAGSQTNEYEQRYASVQTTRHDSRLTESQTNEFEHRYAGVQTTRHEKRLAESQTNEFEQRYAGVQTTGHDKRYAESQTIVHEHKYAGVQIPAHDKRYAESQTSRHEHKYAGVQTTGHDKRYAESQTNEHERRYAGVQTSGYDKRYGASQTNEHERRHAGVQTTDREHGDESMKPAPEQTVDHAESSQSAQPGLNDAALGYPSTTKQAFEAHQTPGRHILAHESTPSTGKTRYYSPEYGRMDDYAGVEWKEDSEGAQDPSLHPDDQLTSDVHADLQVRQRRTHGRPNSPESPPTPSTPSSDPVHEANVAAALALHPDEETTTETYSDALQFSLSVPSREPDEAQIPPGLEPRQPSERTTAKSESGVQAETLTSTIITQTDGPEDEEAMKREHLKPRLRRTRLRRMDDTEKMAFAMITKALRSGSSGDSSSATSASSVQVTDVSAFLSPGELEGEEGSTDRRTLPRYSGLEEDLTTRYFKLKRYSAQEAAMLMQDRRYSSNLSEGETDVGALYGTQEPGQAQLRLRSYTVGGHIEAGEIVWGGGTQASNSPRYRSSLSEGEVDKGDGSDPGQISR